MNLKDLPEGLPAKIIKIEDCDDCIGWIVRKLNNPIKEESEWKLEKIDDSKEYFTTYLNNEEFNSLIELELDYNTPFSIRYLPEGYVAEIVGCIYPQIKEYIGNKVKIDKNNLLINLTNNGNNWDNLQELKDKDVFQLKLVKPNNEDELIEPIDLNIGEEAIIVEWGCNIPIIGKILYRGDNFYCLSDSKSKWPYETVIAWKNTKLKRISKDKNIMSENIQSIPSSKKTKFDFSNFFTQFVKLTLEVKQKDQALFEHVVKKICQGTQHNNLIEFNNDTNIDVLTKVNIYTAATCAIQDSKILNFDKPTLIKSTDAGNDAIRMQYDHLATQFNQLNEHKEQLVKNLQNWEIKGQQLNGEIEQLKKNAPQILQIVDRILTDKGEEIECLDETRIKAQIGPEERFHNQLPDILKILKIRNARGFTEFIWLWGAPGSGKTHLGEQISRGLQLQYYPFPADPTVTAGKLLGFNNIATGSFIQGWLYKPYKEGGLAFIDEGDLMDASCFAGANSIENAYFTFGNGERVERHKDFYLIVSANTKGTGATKGFQRNKLDAATLNRFTMIELEYDEDLEKKIYGNPNWAKYVHKVRAYCNNTFKETVHITSRPIRKGAAYLTDKTISREYICNITLFCLMTKDQKQQVLNNIGVYQDISVIDVNQDATLYFTELKQSIKNQFKLPNDKISAIKYLREQINQKMGIISGPVYAAKALGDLNGFIQYCQSLGEFPKEYHNTPIYK